MRKNIIFGTLVVAVMLLGTITPMVVAEDRDPGQQDYWIVHDAETTDNESQGFQQQNWFYYSNWNDYLSKGPFDEVWYTEYYGPIVPIRTYGWKQNTWISGDVTINGPDTTLAIKLYATPANNYPEYINWTVSGGVQSAAFFRITVYDWDDPETIISTFDLSAYSAGGDEDKLGRYVDQFILDLEYFDP